MYFENLEMIMGGLEVFTKDCVEGITVNVENCVDEVERSIGIVTALCPYIGYTKASKLAKKALKEKKNIRQLLLEENIVKKEDIDRILNPEQMI